jgi:DNA helicase-2/ATP-dependent DNA helicase PcrA
LVRDLIDQGKVTDPNQIAFLFPSLKSPYARRLINALQGEGLKVYAPRAGRFLETDEALAIFGIYLQIFGKPVRAFGGREYHAFHDWIDAAWTKGADLLKDDTGLRKYAAHLRAEIATAIFDYNLLAQVVSRRGWKLVDSCVSQMRAELLRVRGLSPNVWSSLNGKALDSLIELRQQEGRPISLGYVINRVTSLDWNVLDVFYRLCEFKEVKAYIDSAENGADEGPICNLALISQYVARYLEEYTSVLTAEALAQNNFQRVFFSSYLYVLFQRGDSEFENAEDPFPRGRIPFITIHQAKGLEFPVVVLGNPRKDTNRPQLLEELVAPLIDCGAHAAG